MPAQNPRHPSEIAQRETRSPWDLPVPGSFSVSEGKGGACLFTLVEDAQRWRGPPSGTSRSFAPLRAEPRLTKLPGEATVLGVGPPGTHWRAGTAWPMPPRRASVPLAAVVRVCWGQRSPAVLETQQPKNTFCAREGHTCGFGVSFQRVRLSRQNASKLAQSSKEGEGGSVSRLIGRVVRM